MAGEDEDLPRDAKIVYSEHAGKPAIDCDDVKLTIQSKVNFSFSQPPPRKLSSPFRTSWLGWLGAAMEDQSSLFCMRGGPSIFVWGGALQIQPPFWSLSYRFSSQMLCSCVAVPDALHPSSHRTGLAQRISGFLGWEEDLRKKNWSNQYENPQSAHQSAKISSTVL
ncbi:unnamed protein product [Prunus armeniaca]